MNLFARFVLWLGGLGFLAFGLAFLVSPLETLAAEGNLFAYHHDGFWQPMDTLRDRNHLESLWSSGAAPWKVWA